MLFICILMHFYTICMGFSHDYLVAETAASAAAAAPTAPVPSPCTVWVEAPPPRCAAGCVFGLVGAGRESTPGSASDRVESSPVV